MQPKSSMWQGRTQRGEKTHREEDPNILYTASDVLISQESQAPQTSKSMIKVDKINETQPMTATNRDAIFMQSPIGATGIISSARKMIFSTRSNRLLPIDLQENDPEKIMFERDSLVGEAQQHNQQQNMLGFQKNNKVSQKNIKTINVSNNNINNNKPIINEKFNQIQGNNSNNTITFTKSLSPKVQDDKRKFGGVNGNSQSVTPNNRLSIFTPRNQNNTNNNNNKVAPVAAAITDFSFWSVVQIRKMMEKLKTKYAYANLTPSHYELLGDKSAFSHKKDYDYRSQGSWQFFKKKIRRFNRYCSSSSLAKRIQQIFSFFPVFNPSNTMKQLWDLINCLSMLVLFFSVPLHLAVSQPIGQLVPLSLLWLVLVLVTLDSFVSLNTGYFSKGHIVQSRLMIFQNYASNQLPFDILALIPLYLVLSIEQSSTFNFYLGLSSLLFFFKVRDFARVLKKIEESFLLQPTSTNLLALLKLLFVILIIAHLCACIWVYEASQYDSPDSSWYGIDKLQINSFSPLWFDMYIKAYYFSTVTMVTVGYGDIYPTSNTERLISIGTMLLACCIFAYIVNSIGNIFQDFFRHSKEVKDNFYAINNYMEKKSISSSLKLKIKEYLSYYWDEERDNLAEKEHKIIGQLSESLRHSLKLEANKIVLADTPVFHNNFSKSFNEKICSLISEQRAHPEQVLTNYGEEDDCSIFFIQKGKVEIFISHLTTEGTIRQKSYMTLEKGQYFGTFSFFTGMPRNLSVRSAEFCQLLVIKRQDFIENLRLFDDDYQRFCMIKDQLMFDAQNSSIQQPCFCCGNKGHIFTLCPVIHYAPPKREVIKKYNFSSTHHRRNKKERDNKDKFHTLLELEITIKEGLRYLEQNESFLLDQEWLESDENTSEESSFTDSDEDSEENGIEERETDEQSDAEKQQYQQQQKYPLNNNNNSNNNMTISFKPIRKSIDIPGGIEKIEEVQSASIIQQMQDTFNFNRTSSQKYIPSSPPNEPMQTFRNPSGFPQEDFNMNGKQSVQNNKSKRGSINQFDAARKNLAQMDSQILDLGEEVKRKQSNEIQGSIELKSEGLDQQLLVKRNPSNRQSYYKLRLSINSNSNNNMTKSIQQQQIKDDDNNNNNTNDNGTKGLKRNSLNKQSSKSLFKMTESCILKPNNNNNENITKSINELDKSEQSLEIFGGFFEMMTSSGTQQNGLLELESEKVENMNTQIDLRAFEGFENYQIKPASSTSASVKDIGEKEKIILSPIKQIYDNKNITNKGQGKNNTQLKEDKDFEGQDNIELQQQYQQSSNTHVNWGDNGQENLITQESEFNNNHKGNSSTGDQSKRININQSKTIGLQKQTSLVVRNNLENEYDLEDTQNYEQNYPSQLSRLDNIKEEVQTQDYQLRKSQKQQQTSQQEIITRNRGRTHHNDTTNNPSETRVSKRKLTYEQSNIQRLHQLDQHGYKSSRSLNPQQYNPEVHRFENLTTSSSQLASHQQYFQRQSSKKKTIEGYNPATSKFERSSNKKKSTKLRGATIINPVVNEQSSSPLAQKLSPNSNNNISQSDGTSPITPSQQERAIKKERFWKHLQKHGAHMAAGSDLSSPLVIRAQRKLEQSEGLRNFTFTQQSINNNNNINGSFNGNYSDRDKSPQNNNNNMNMFSFAPSSSPYSNSMNSNVVKHVRSGSNNHLNHRSSIASNNIVPYGGVAAQKTSDKKQYLTQQQQNKKSRKSISSHYSSMGINNFNINNNDIESLNAHQNKRHFGSSGGVMNNNINYQNPQFQQYSHDNNSTNNNNDHGMQQALGLILQRIDDLNHIQNQQQQQFQQQQQQPLFQQHPGISGSDYGKQQFSKASTLQVPNSMQSSMPIMQSRQQQQLLLHGLGNQFHNSNVSMTRSEKHNDFKERRSGFNTLFDKQPYDFLQLDLMKIFNCYYPEHNITVIMGLLNKNSNEQLKQLRRNKLKKNKANQLLLNQGGELNKDSNLNIGNICEQFKKRLIASRVAKHSYHKFKNVVNNNNNNNNNDSKNLNEDSEGEQLSDKSPLFDSSQVTPKRNRFVQKSHRDIVSNNNNNSLNNNYSVSVGQQGKLKYQSSQSINPSLYSNNVIQNYNNSPKQAVYVPSKFKN